MSAPDAVRTVLRHWALVLVAVVLGVVGGSVYSATASPTYSSSSQVLVTIRSSGSTTDRLQGASYISQVLPTYTSAITSSSVLEPVIQQLHLSTGVAALAKDVSATAGTDTAIITVTADAGSPRAARALAAAVTNRFIQVAPDLLSPTSAAGTSTATAGASGDTTPADLRLSTVSVPTTPTGPTSPGRLVVVLLGLVAGLIVGIGIALALGAADRRVRSAEQAAAIADAPVIGRLPRLPARAWHDRSSVPAWTEAVRDLRESLLARAGDRPTITFLGSTTGEGVTTVVADVATAFARAGVPTTVLDMDLRSSDLQAGLAVRGERGLVDVVNGRAELSDVLLRPASLPALSVVPGGRGSDAGDVFTARNLQPVVDHLHGSAEVVLVDTPPANGFSEALAAARIATAVVLVVGIGEVTTPTLSAVVERLWTSGQEVLGVVAVRVPAHVRVPSAHAAARRSIAATAPSGA
ncbi:Wzz/FepE/Etk N-terminal domain-containing protein [Curtobacterium sp. MCBD17_019]|nr:Wzz/FepE/Etk N-terminal domain-containing protein [Curtobacterium sp. MCBD17_019]